MNQLHRIFYRSLHLELLHLRSESRSTAIELARSEQQTLSLHSEVERLRAELASRPSQEEVRLLKTQLDHLLLRYERRQIYNTISVPGADSVPPMLSVASANNAPLSFSRSRKASEELKSALSDMIEKEWAGRMASYTTPASADPTEDAPTSPTAPSAIASTSPQPSKPS